MKTSTISFLCFALISAGCGTSVRTYQSNRLNPEFRYAWILKSTSGDGIIFYDLSRMKLSPDSLEVPSSNRSLAIDDISSIERMETTRSRSATTALTTALVATCAVLGLFAGAALAKTDGNRPERESGGNSDEVYFNWDLDFTPVITALAGAVAGAGLAEAIDVMSSHDGEDLSGMSIEAKFHYLHSLKQQYTRQHSMPSPQRFVMVERVDGIFVEGEVILIMNKELLILQTKDGEIKMAWKEIKTITDVVK